MTADPTKKEKLQGHLLRIAENVGFALYCTRLASDDLSDSLQQIETHISELEKHVNQACREVAK